MSTVAFVIEPRIADLRIAVGIGEIKAQLFQIKSWGILTQHLWQTGVSVTR